MVAYQCLSGHRPFEGDNPLEIAMRHVRDAPPPLPADIPPVVRQVVDRAMAKDPAARWPNAAALAQVARRTATQLAGGSTSASGMANLAVPTGPGSPVAPVSPAVLSSPPGPPGSPVSRQYPMPPPISPMVPPGSPVSPGFPAGPVAAGGTRIMPGVTPGSPPTSGPPSSQHGARGAAGVPPPPSANDTAYTYGGGAPAAVPPPPPTPVRPGRPPGRPGGGGSGRNNLAIIAVVLGVLVVLLFGAGVIWFLTKASGSGGSGTTTPTAGTTTGAPKPTGELVNVPCAQLRNRQLFVVQRNLEQRGFKVVTQQVTGAIPNNVTDVSPCGNQPKGSTITLKVVKSAIDPGFPSNGGSPPGDGQSPGGPGGPSTSPSCDNPVPGTNLCLPS